MSTKNDFLFLGFYSRRGARASGWRPPFRHQGRLSRRGGQYQAFIERRGRNSIILYFMYYLKNILLSHLKFLLWKPRICQKINWKNLRNLKLIQNLNPKYFEEKRIFHKAKNFLKKLILFWKIQEKAKKFFNKPRIF